MRNIISFIACCIIAVTLLQYRGSYIQASDKPLKVTDWDALGYYIYLPSILIYHDIRDLGWFTEIDNKYQLSGGSFYQAGDDGKGHRVYKYLGGISILQLPFFLMAHAMAEQLGYPADGFSQPYQYAVALAAIFYCLLGFFVLRRLLLVWFDDLTVAITLLLVGLATNLIRYVSIEGGMSHAYIFALYPLVLFTTYKWHKQPKATWAFLTGYIIGLAAISRPTEGVMLFIPLLWGTQDKEAAKAKWQMVKKNRSHIYVAILGGLLGILPQLIYWKMATGSFIYDVGSAWVFLNPYFRVLFGWEKGWFIYTPVTIFFILGLFFVKKYPFKKSVIWFCILNIYIIISWADWRYGASYSTRALVQSYPVFALPLAAFVAHVRQKKWQWLFYALGLYLIGVNLFQIVQYNKTILHYNDMNRKYYAHIYLNPHPDAFDMSLLDTDEFLKGENKYNKTILIDTGNIPLTIKDSVKLIAMTSMVNAEWLKLEADIMVNSGIWESYLCAELQKGDSAKRTHIRLFNAITSEGQSNHYGFYMKVPEWFKESPVKVYIKGHPGFDGTVGGMTVTAFSTK